jgi:hypothetical protein
MKSHVVAVFMAAVAACLAVGVATASGGGSTINGTTHCNPGDPICGLNPILTGTGPPPPFVTVTGNCPAFLFTDPWELNFVDGNSVSHGTLNKNGDWGGGTANGTAVLMDGNTLEYSGQATEWGGGGQNSNPGGPPTNQSAGGFTFHFNGSGPAGTITIHIHSHQTTNNSGTPTSSVDGGAVTCG